MAPADYLSLVVEVSIAIAGFSGIVFALGRDTASRWSEVERVRFGALVSTSFVSFGISGLALLLLASDVPEARAWRIASSVDALAMAVLLPRRMFALLRSLDAPGSRRIAWGFLTLSFGVIALLLLNAFRWATFWPLGTAVSYHLLTALISFMGLIAPPGNEASGG